MGRMGIGEGDRMGMEVILIALCIRMTGMTIYVLVMVGDGCLSLEQVVPSPPTHA